ncbi:DEAD/DEAH box helicase [Pseudoalteromonas xiamenensis]|uniref:DEAD/DEAH box helicase n=1 Tax=Pseudoalteromonas xiamenensis TaxID=882626 RepID=UPI0027E49161|nr:DEAD/DEAH box helicase [Pseudoalteromonas xiamenensis]WMN59982.1 DEAD/DEAH box helicase [Pseudoalteromonas xiamenensis]
MFFNEFDREKLEQQQRCIEDLEALTLLQIVVLVVEPIKQTQLVKLIEYFIEAGFTSCSTAEPLIQKKSTLIEYACIRVTENGIEAQAHAANLAVNQLSDVQLRRLKLVIEDAEQDYVISKSDKRQAYFALLLEDTTQYGAYFPTSKDPQLIPSAYLCTLHARYFAPFSVDTFLTLPNYLQYQAFAAAFKVRVQNGLSIHPTCKQLGLALQKNANNTPLRLLHAELSLYQAQIEQFKCVQDTLGKTSWSHQLQGMYRFIIGDFESAFLQFEQALTAKQKYSRKKYSFFDEIPALCYLLTLIALKDKPEYDSLSLLFAFVESLRQNRTQCSNFLYTGLLLEAIAKYIQNDAVFDATKIDIQHLSKQDPFYSLLLKWAAQLGVAWTDSTANLNFVTLKQLAAQFDSLGFPLLANWCQTHVKNPSTVTPLNLVAVKPSWEQALDKLVALNTNPVEFTPVSQADKRVLWKLHKTRYAVRITAHEQIQQESSWITGNEIPLSKLKDAPHAFRYLSPRDKQVCAKIQRVAASRYTEPYLLEGLKALKQLVGAQNVLLVEHQQEYFSLVEKAPVLVVNEQAETITLQVHPLPEFNFAGEAYSVLCDQTIELVIFEPQHIAIVDIVSEQGLSIPRIHKNKILDTIKAISPLLSIESNLPDIQSTETAVKARNDLVINIKPYRHGLSFQCVVMPFGENGPSYVPGIGSEFITAKIHNERLSTTRDLLFEQTLLDTLDSICPAFQTMAANTLNLPELSDALSVLEVLETEIRETNDHTIRLQWQKGKSLSVSTPLQTHQLQLGLYQKNEWFDLTGELQIDEKTVIAIKPLLGLVNTHQGRFIPLENGEILNLSQALRDKLDELNLLTDEGHFSEFAARLVYDSTTGLRMQTVPGWDALKSKLHESNELELAIAHNLQASLRPYQVEGVFWALRLAHWGAGACLADDMGLGKTLQAIAVLLARASEGPSLIIAPTSVCYNWQHELVRFAPSLNVIILSQTSTGEDRTSLLANLQPFDCVVVSYSLLQRLADELKRIRWSTTVADEAQFLKNPLSSRSKAAYTLKSGFKMALTGTPIENNLTELWSIFRFVNPGLLGNLKRFSARFTIPIERKEDDPVAAKKANAGLKALLSPFLLRRTKEEVLKDLPDKTEIDLPVVLSSEEMAFYESLRQNAVDELTKTALVQNPGEQRLRMLAELVKLRQACCDARLLIEQSTLPNSKMTTLLSLMQSLRENNHKVLIFSQFVGFLTLIRKAFDEHNIPYQYLDGGTPTEARQNRIAAFQQGEGDAFLISLKAGGFGLNLTQADYVIHMDPWWNPAVQDQATDRVHRIGQTKPVTVYRLFAQHTVEERILELHEKKRALATHLLADTDMVQPTDVNEVLTMLKEVF